MLRYSSDIAANGIRQARFNSMPAQLNLDRPDIPSGIDYFKFTSGPDVIIPAFHHGTIIELFAIGWGFIPACPGGFFVGSGFVHDLRGAGGCGYRVSGNDYRYWLRRDWI